MIVEKSHKIRLVPNEDQKRMMTQSCVAARVAYNWALYEWNSQYEDLRILEGLGYGVDKSEYPSKFGIKKQFNAAKRSDDRLKWILDVSQRAPERAFDDLGAAFKNFFRDLKRGSGAQYPRFKRKGTGNSYYQSNNSIKLDGKRVRLEKVGWVKMREELRFDGKILGARVSHRAGKWFISIQVRSEVPDPEHPAPGVSVGVDMGVKCFAAFSTGEMVESANALSRLEDQLRRAQKTLSRRQGPDRRRGQKAGKNWLKAKTRVQKIQNRISNIRNHHTHETTRRLVDENETVVIEDLNVKDMTESAKGNMEAPGKNVRQKSDLNKSILDQGFYEFRRQLEYKASWCGGRVVLVDPAYTSQTCSQCGNINADNRVSQADFRCVKCGHSENADVNAAKNIFNRGISEQLS